MGRDTSANESMTDLLARLGVVVTVEGKQRARRRLADADARRDHSARAAFLAQLRRPSAA